MPRVATAAASRFLRVNAGSSPLCGLAVRHALETSVLFTYDIAHDPAAPERSRVITARQGSHRVALDVVEVGVALGLLEHELLLAVLHGDHAGDLAESARCAVEEAVEDLLVAEEVFGEVMDVDVDNGHEDPFLCARARSRATR